MVRVEPPSVRPPASMERPARTREKGFTPGWYQKYLSSYCNTASTASPGSISRLV